MQIPPLLHQKIVKTGTTRGADDDEIYQNRVSRSSTVLIPFSQWECNEEIRNCASRFVNGYIVLIPPRIYFENNFATEMESRWGLFLGVNALVFYEKRSDWNLHNPEANGWMPATSRKNPLGGQYVARVPATTSLDETSRKKINVGFAGNNGKGAGIRLYEYADAMTIADCKLQLEALFWACHDSVETAVGAGMAHEDALARKADIFKRCGERALLDWDHLAESRIVDSCKQTICPLCLQPICGRQFLSRLAQAEGREVEDLTITQVSLFHINELRYGVFNHRPYNLGWGHHDCNVVVKDHGISETLKWMQGVLDRNRLAGFVPPAPSPHQDFRQD